MTISFWTILYWSIIIYFACYICGRILSYVAAILHYWSTNVLEYWQLWFDKGTTIKSLYEDISSGGNFIQMYEIRFVPIMNLLMPAVWLLGEIVFFIFVIIIHLIRYLLYICEIFYTYILSPIIKPCNNSINKIDYPKTFIGKIIIFVKTLYKDIKNKFLSFRIA